MSLKAIFAAMSIKIKVLVVCAAVVVVGGTAAAVGISMTKEDTYRVLKVFEMSGEATVSREGSGELSAYVGMNLESGDTVSVAEGGTVRLSLDGDKYIQLDELTVLELEASGSKTDSRTIINLKEGTILNEITKPLSENSMYEVATPKATMAVRGTSFSVTVTKDSEGRYIITENTYHGKVEATLLDEAGAPTSKTAMVNADRSITICTSPNEKTGNPAEIDGTSVFVVYDTETGEMQIVPDGEDPTHDIDYDLISAIVKEYALRSNDTNLMALDENVVKKLRGSLQGADAANADAPSTQPERTEAPVSETDASESAHETVNSDNFENVVSSDVPNEGVAPADTTVSETLAETTEAADTSITEATSSEETTTVPETTTEPETTTVPETTTEPETTTVPETTTAPKTTTAPETTTEPKTTTAPETTTAPKTTTVPETTKVPETTTAPETTKSEEPTVFDITFKCDGEILKTVPAKLGDSLYDIVSEVAVPDKEGKSGVWKINGITAVTSDMKVEGEVTLEAVYSANKYTITFVADGADEAAPKPVEALYGDSLYDIVSACAVPAKKGYKGIWLVNGTPVTESMTVTKDVTVTAVYSIQKFTVSFSAPDADDQSTVPAPVEVDYGTKLSKIVPAAVPEKTGHTGVWKINGTTDITADSIVDSDMTVKAVYTINKYTVTFEAEGADNAADIPAASEYDYGTLLSKIVPASVPARKGHTGVWKIDGTTDITAEMTLTKDITVKAVYTAVKYTVTFDASESDDGTGTPAPAKYDYGTLLSGIVPEKVPVKTGHTGVWKIDGKTDITAESIVDGDMTIKAVYSPVKYTITFTAPGADASSVIPAPVKAEYGSLIKDSLPAAIPEKKGHTGVWKIDGKTALTDEMTVDGDITLTAVYTINKYTVTFTAPQADDPTDVPDAVEVEYGTLFKEIVTYEVPVKTGHTGVWKIKGEYDIDSTATVSEDVTVTAVYDKNKYTITFDVSKAGNTATAPEPVTAEYEDDLYEIISSIDVPKKAGNDGVWKIKGSEITSPYPVYDDITVTADYIPRTYVTINYNFDGNTGTVQGDSGESLKYDIIPKKIQKVEYPNDLMNPYAWLTYNNSWSSDGNSNADRVDSGMAVNDYVIEQDEVEVWSAKKHTVSYTAGDKSGKFYLYDGESIVYIYDGFLDSILNGYTGFIKADGEEFTNTSTVNEDTTITAYKYKVTLSYIGDKSPEYYFFGEGESFNSKYDGMPTPNALTGYEATEWMTFDSTVISPSDTISSDMTLVPNQIAKSYSVTFEIPDGTPTTEDISFESPILNKAPSLDASIYNAWYIGTTKLESTTTLSDLVDSGVITGEETSITVTAGGDTSVNYTVTFTADDSSTVLAAEVLAYGTKLAEYLETNVTMPQKSGSDGVWKIKTTNGLEAISADYIVHKDIIVAADYTERTSVNVNYTFNGTPGTVTGNRDERLEANIIPKIDTTTYANNLMNPYIWMTKNSNWYSGATGDVQVESGMEVNDYVLDQGDVSVWTKNKHTITYTVDGTTGKFYLPDGKSISDDYTVSNFLSGLLGSHAGFVTNGYIFTENTRVTSNLSIYAYDYTVTLDFVNQADRTYYFTSGNKFGDGELPAPDAASGNTAVNWTTGSGIFDPNTPITSNLVLTPLQISTSADFSLAFYDRDGSNLLNDPSNCLVSYNTNILNYAPIVEVDYWTVNGVKITSTTTVADVITGSEGTIKIIAVY